MPTLPVRTVFVTMPHARMRRALFEQQLQRDRAIHEIIGRPEYVTGMPPRNCHAPVGIDLTQHSWSCYMTQLREIDRALAERADALLILEDDIVFDSTFVLGTVQFLRAVLQALELGQLSDVPHVFMLGGNHKAKPRDVAPGFYVCTDTTMHHAWLLTRAGLAAVSELLHDFNYVRELGRTGRKQNKDQVVASAMACGRVRAVCPRHRWLAHQRVGRSDRSGTTFRARPGWGVARTNPNVRWKE